MIGLQIDDSPLARTVTALAQFEPTVRAEFTYAGERTGADLKRDLKRGVGKVSGRLESGISAAVRPKTGVEIDLLMGAQAEQGGYDYAGRLDKDGSLTWRTGKYKGRRTWGWFSYVGPRVAARFFRRNYQLALDKAVRKLMGQG